MSTSPTPNLMGITGIARRLVLDSALDEAVARKAMDGATAEKMPLATYLADRRLVSPGALAAANSVEFGMPLVDALAIDPAQSAISLVKEELLRKHQVLPLFKRGNRLFVGTPDPTSNRAMEELHGTGSGSLPTERGQVHFLSRQAAEVRYQQRGMPHSGSCGTALQCPHGQTPPN